MIYCMRITFQYKDKSKFLRVICRLSFARSWPSTAAKTIIIISRIKSKTARTISLVLFKNNPGKAWNAASFPEGCTLGSLSTSGCLSGVSASLWQSAITYLQKKVVVEQRLLDNYVMILKSDSRSFRNYLFMTSLSKCSKQVPLIYVTLALLLKCGAPADYIATKSRLKPGWPSKFD